MKKLFFSLLFLLFLSGCSHTIYPLYKKEHRCTVNQDGSTYNDEYCLTFRYKYDGKYDDKVVYVDKATFEACKLPKENQSEKE